MSSILLKNCFYIFLSVDEGSRRGQDILIRENRIAEIGSDILDPVDRVIDCSTLGVMKMGTENGARLLGLEKVGKIKEGWAADLALFNVGKLEYSGSLADPLAAIIFSGYNHGAEYTIVNGKIAVEQGKLTGFNEIELMNKCNEISENLINQ